MSTLTVLRGDFLTPIQLSVRSECYFWLPFSRCCRVKILAILIYSSVQFSSVQMIYLYSTYRTDCALLNRVKFAYEYPTVVISHEIYFYHVFALKNVKKEQKKAPKCAYRLYHVH